MFLIRRFDPEIHHRRSIRLKRYDYSSPGAYFITICSLDRPVFFGHVNDGRMNLNPFGEIVYHAWHDLPNHNPHIVLDAFVVMPDHVHGIIVIRGAGVVGAGSKPAPDMDIPQPPTGAGHGPTPTMDIPQPPTGAGRGPAPTMDFPQPPTGAGRGPAPTGPATAHHALPEIIRQFKSFSARRINILRGSRGKPVWQRNYYENIVRTDNDLQRIRAYIIDNPVKYQG